MSSCCAATNLDEGSQLSALLNLQATTFHLRHWQGPCLWGRTTQGYAWGPCPGCKTTHIPSCMDRTMQAPAQLNPIIITCAVVPLWALHRAAVRHSLHCASQVSWERGAGWQCCGCLTLGGRVSLVQPQQTLPCVAGSSSGVGCTASGRPLRTSPSTPSTSLQSR